MGRRSTPGHVRWTEGRNLESVLDLLAAGKLTVADLVTHRFPVEEAASAYELIANEDARFLGVELTYLPSAAEARVVTVNPRRLHGPGGIGLLGAGKFARATLVPACKEAGFERLAVVASASGLSAKQLAERAGFERATSSTDEVIEDPDVDVVVIATPHDLHARLTAEALRAGKHVFCEKPLALTFEELDDVIAAWRSSSGQLMVGFNRRHAPDIIALRSVFQTGGPLVMTYRVNAGRLPSDHWYNDRRQGGRLLGEICHFIDTCNAVAGASPVSVSTIGARAGEVLLCQDMVVTLAYGDGSVATISYASDGHNGTAKERFEVLGQGHTALIDDYRRLVIDERVARKGQQDKGHVAQLREFRRSIAGGTDSNPQTLAALDSMRATLAAAESLRDGRMSQL